MADKVGLGQAGTGSELREWWSGPRGRVRGRHRHPDDRLPELLWQAKQGFASGKEAQYMSPGPGLRWQRLASLERPHAM